jgi:hypothetical protein
VSELWPWGSFARGRGKGVVVRVLAGFVVCIFVLLDLSALEFGVSIY